MSGHSSLQTRARRALLSTASVIALTLAPLPALAQTTYTWTGATATYEAAGNWGGAGFPQTGADTAQFGATGNSTPTISTSITVGSFIFLSGAQSYAVTVAAGSLTVNTGIVDNTTASITVNGPISGAGSLTVNAGTMTLTGANNYTGGTNITAGTLVLGSGGSLSATGSVTLSGAGTFDVSSANQTIGDLSGLSGTIALGGSTLTLGTASDESFGGTVTGGGGLIKQGSGVQTLGGNNTFSNGVTINAGGLIVGNNAALGTGALTVGGASTLDSASAITLANNIVLNAGLTVLGSNALTLNGNMSGTGAVTKDGAATLTVNGTNTYTGGTSINAGTLALGAGASLASGGIVAVASGATLDISAGNGTQSFGTLVGSGTINIGANTLTVGGPTNGTFSGAIVGTGALDKQGTGTETLTGASTFTGGTTVDAGTLAIGAGGSLSTTGSVTLAALGTSFDISAGGNQTIGGLSGVAGATVSLGGNTLTLAGTGNSTFDGAIDGPGSITKTGNGTQTFTGTNIYSGGTIITGGEISISSAANLGAGGVTLNGGALQITGTALTSLSGMTFGSAGGGFDIADAANTFTVSQPLSGQGGFTKSGVGTLVLSGTNTYTGATDVTGGTLKAGAAGSFSAASAMTVGAADTLDLGGFDQSVASLAGAAGAIVTNSGGSAATLTAGGDNSSTTFAGVIQNGASPVALTLTGANGLTLTGSNTYTGGTIISSGALLVGNGGTTGAIVGNVVSGVTTANAGINFNRSDNITFAGDISGLGYVAQQGAGTLTLTGNNTYQAYTALVQGTVAVGSPSNLGAGDIKVYSGILQLTNSLSLAQNFQLSRGAIDTGANNVTLSGILSTMVNTNVAAGYGGLTKTGTGTLILTGTNSYVGPTTISAGTLQIGNGGTAGSLGSGDVTDNGTLVFNHSDAVTFAGAISGSGGVTQAGAGNLILSGNNSFGGPVSITAGTLSVNGTVTGTTTVGSGGTLGGNGTIGNTVIASGGTLAPGNSIGTLHVNGNLALNSGATYAVQVSPTAADRIIVSGTASLAGTLALNPDAGTYVAGTDYNLVSAANVSGVFGSVTGNSFAGLNSTIVYSATGVDLNLSAPGTGSGGGGGTTLPPTITYLFGTYGTTANQIAVGQALTAGAPTTPLYLAAGSAVAAGTRAIAGALGQLSGDIHASLRSAAIEDSRIIRNAVLDHVHQAADGVIVWGSGFGASGSIGGTGNANGIQHNDAGLIAGVDMPLGYGVRAGVGGAYTEQLAKVADTSSRATGTMGHVMTYLNWQDEAYDLSFGGVYGWGRNHVARQVSAFSETNSDRQDNRTSQVFGDTGYKFLAQGAMFEPYAGLAWISAKTGSFQETGGLAALYGPGQSSEETYSTLGIRSVVDGITVGDGMMLSPRINLGWQHAFNTLVPNQRMAFAATNQSFTISGVPLDSDAALLQLGLDLAISPAAVLSIGYDGDVSGRIEEHAIRGGLTWKF